MGKEYYVVYMRTTIAIDDDLMLRIRKNAVESGLSLKEVVNKTLRNGIEKIGEGKNAEYSGKTFSLGYPPHMDLTRSLDVAAALEDEEIIRRLQLRK